MAKLETPGELSVVYSNAVQFHTSISDFSMLFGLSQPPLDPKTKVVEIIPQIRVILSPTHFKEFVRIATKQLEGYEVAHGKIPTPEAKPTRKKKQTKK